VIERQVELFKETNSAFVKVDNTDKRATRIGGTDEKPPSLVLPASLRESANSVELGLGGKKAKVEIDFEAEGEGELSVKKGETLTVLRDAGQGWFYVKSGINDGLVPKDYVSIIEN